MPSSSFSSQAPRTNPSAPSKTSYSHLHPSNKQAKETWNKNWYRKWKIWRINEIFGGLNDSIVNNNNIIEKTTENNEGKIRYKNTEQLKDESSENRHKDSIIAISGGKEIIDDKGDSGENNSKNNNREYRMNKLNPLRSINKSNKTVGYENSKNRVSAENAENKNNEINLTSAEKSILNKEGNITDNVTNNRINYSGSVTENNRQSRSNNRSAVNDCNLKESL